MRTTLDIDDDLLEVAKEEARRTKSSAGKVISAWARKGLTQPQPYPADMKTKEGADRVKEEPYVTEYGFEPLPAKPGVVPMTVDQIKELELKMELDEHLEVIEHWEKTRAEDSSDEAGDGGDGGDGGRE